MRQTILTVFLIAFILATGFVWFRYVRPSPGSAPAVTVSPEERLSQYRGLKDLRADTSVLSDPLFESLSASRPGATSTPRAGSGRSNPFAPLP